MTLRLAHGFGIALAYAPVSSLSLMNIPVAFGLLTLASLAVIRPTDSLLNLSELIFSSFCSHYACTSQVAYFTQLSASFFKHGTTLFTTVCTPPCGGVCEAN